MTITTDRDKLRLEIGDTDSGNYVFFDDELDYFLDAETSNIQAAKLHALEAGVLKLGRMYDFEADGQKFRRSQMAERWQKEAERLRALGVTTATDTSFVSVNTVDVTRVDGYSTGVPNSDVSLSVSGRRRFATETFDLDDLP